MCTMYTLASLHLTTNTAATKCVCSRGCPAHLLLVEGDVHGPEQEVGQGLGCVAADVWSQAQL